MYRYFFKRLIDFLAAFLGLLILSPVFLIIVIALTISNRGKPFFFQKRPGKNEKIFKVIKFKSMNDRKDEKGHLLPDKERLTKMGAFVRKTSLDEIPQLINVLIGNMSLIGPRPLLIQYLPYYKKREKLRHRVRSGITGWAQVNGRNNLDWDKRLALDVEYVENLSFKMDWKILITTLKQVIKRKDIVVVPGESLIKLDKYRK